MRKKELTPSHRRMNESRKKKMLALGLVAAVAATIGLCSACSSNAATVVPQETSYNTQKSIDEQLSATATASVGESASGELLASGSPAPTQTPAQTKSTASASSSDAVINDSEEAAAATATPQTQTTSSDTSSDTYSMKDTGDYAIVKLGSDNAAVKALQENLTDLGYLNGATGYFGTDTETALEAFQSANSLTPDGVAGNSTWDVLLSGNAIEA